MATPCPSCNKFCSLDNEVDDLDDIEILDSTVTATARVYRTSQCCSEEMYETTFDLEGPIVPDAAEPGDEECDHTWEEDSSTVEVTESGGARFAKNMIGVLATVELKCECGAMAQATMQDALQASAYESLV